MPSKLSFKGEKPKKKKRSHKETEGGEDDLALMAAGDPRGWVFPEDLLEINGPSYIILPTEPLTCLAWHAAAQKVYAAPIDIPQAPEGHLDLSTSEILSSLEPTDVNTVWVISRLSGSEDVISLRTSSGTFLSAPPSGVLSATTPSRGPLEAFVPSLIPPSSSSSSSDPSSSSSPFPTLFLKTNSMTFLSATSAGGLGSKVELRADADKPGQTEGLRIKCQREFVLRAKLEKADGGDRGEGKIRRMLDGGAVAGSLEDEMNRNKEAQTWGAGRAVVSDKDRKDVKKARKEGRLAEAMLDRRAAMKSDRYAK